MHRSYYRRGYRSGCGCGRPCPYDCSGYGYGGGYHVRRLWTRVPGFTPQGLYRYVNPYPYGW
jgi:hypothetical protein